MIYLDNNATTMPDPAVWEAMLPYLSDQAYANPSSTHRFGQEARHGVEESRRKLAALLACDPGEILFTSGGTESDNAALWGVLLSGGWVPGNSSARHAIITSAVEHSAIREPTAALARLGVEVLRIPVDQSGALDMQRFAETLSHRASEIALVSIMWANNETGVLFDIPAIGKLCREQSIPFHVDAVQTVGKFPIFFRNLPIDLLSISAHKFHGPKGAGALVIRRGTRFHPLLRGGPQERDRRGGTENVPGIVGMGVAADLAAKSLADGRSIPRVAALRDRFEKSVLASIEDVHIIGNPEARVPNTTNLGFAGLEAEAVLLLLSEQDICASAGAACSSGSLEPSPVLQAMGIDDRIAHGAVRFSLSRFSTDAEIDQTLAILPDIIRRLRATLPV